MPDVPLRDRYLELIDQIVTTTLKGNISSKEQVYQMLLKGVEPGTGEIFERCLEERFTSTQEQIDNPVSEIKQAKATRSLRAISTIRSEWERAQKQNQVSAAINTAINAVTTAEPEERLSALLRAIDPNQQQTLTLQQLKQLSQTLQQQSQQTSDPDSAQEIQQLSEGLKAGLASWQRLEDYLVSWIYDQSQGTLGFGGLPEQRGPWGLWAKQVGSPLPQSLFQTLARNQSLSEWAESQRGIELGAWVELAVVLQCLQLALVKWFDKMVYDSKVGAKLSISTFIVFGVIWSQLAIAFSQALTGVKRDRFVNGSFQVCLQILRTFSQRDYFPLYGGIFASLGGDYLSDALNYLNEPLRRVEGTQEKARILTLLGYSFRAQGLYERAASFHQQALDIARDANDSPCEIANLNHLSRLCVAQKNYAEAISYSQRALILSRQAGNKLGEANALANLGYSEVFQAQQQQQAEPEVYERAINYLEQGVQLSERLGDRQSQSLCFSSLGLAYVIVEQPQQAIAYLESGWQAAQISGDLYLQGLNLAYLSQACYSMANWQKAVYAGALGAYVLEQINASDWRKPAGLLTILQGQLGNEAFQNLLGQNRPKIIALIGVDGYDYIGELLEKYRSSLD
ncbi:MAG: tetratricopeptide repeat protein [Kastovskya adunca ATA6-11-RM4]|jgi:tetratricopeptide (TPR) repeat protein|nr:tetratricopeptide repeat protein [Kastovskya adunca ATA6-11-RM4]